MVAGGKFGNDMYDNVIACGVYLPAAAAGDDVRRTNLSYIGRGEVAPRPSAPTRGDAAEMVIRFSSAPRDGGGGRAEESAWLRLISSRGMVAGRRARRSRGSP